MVKCLYSGIHTTKYNLPPPPPVVIVTWVPGTFNVIYECYVSISYIYKLHINESLLETAPLAFHLCNG